MPLLPSDAKPEVDREWHIRKIGWPLVFWFQDYGCLMTALCFLGLYIRESLHGTPVVRSAMVYDATISLPHVKAHTVESWQAAVLPIALLLATLTWMEFVVFRKINTITNAVTAWLHFTTSSLSAWTTSVWVTSFFKNFAGRLRPDFFARCRPELAHGRHWDGELQYDRFVEVTCTNPDLEKVTHGRFSFPSQHSCWAMTCAWYCLLYFSWTGYARAGGMMQLGRFVEPTLLRRAVREVGAALALLLIFGQVFFVWYIGACRFRENRHNISDIVAGWFMGFIVASLYAMRAIYVYGAIRTEIVRSEARLVATGHVLAEEPAQDANGDANGATRPLLDGDAAP